MDAHWHDRYYLEPYYVSGRGYDQYRPAYALGWQVAQSPEHAQQDFHQVEPVLQARWAMDSGSSLLHWSQVREAAEASWLQARRPRPAPPVANALSLNTTALLNAVLALGRQTHTRLGQCMSPMPQGLIGQVLARHFNASQILVEDLERAIASSGGVALPARTSQAALLRTALWDGLLGREEGADYVLQQAEACQQQWLSAYEAAEKTKLPKPLSETLHRQALMLRGHIEAIHWLRRYML
ncbi:MAG: hypothetical protein LBI66_09335 [Burkholderiaceae bacterium]|nr:hypothetical protein [Burkholderiaceae bacterium]